MFIKEAVLSVSKRILPQKHAYHFESGLVMQFLFLTTLKNYLYSWVNDQKLFIVPEQVRQKALRKKIVLVLDMDETLVYTRRNNQPSHYNYIKSQFDNGMYVQPRPYVRQFLKVASQIFTIYIYTAGKKNYADEVLKIIDPDQVIQKRFYRDSCKKVNGNIIKDLKQLKKSLKCKNQMYLVDDNCLSIQLNYPYALRIQAFEGNQSDKCLVQIFKKLTKLYI